MDSSSSAGKGSAGATPRRSADSYGIPTPGHSPEATRAPASNTITAPSMPGAFGSMFEAQASGATLPPSEPTEEHFVGPSTAGTYQSLTPPNLIAKALSRNIVNAREVRQHSRDAWSSYETAVTQFWENLSLGNFSVDQQSMIEDLRRQRLRYTETFGKLYEMEAEFNYLCAQILLLPQPVVGNPRESESPTPGRDDVSENEFQVVANSQDLLMFHRFQELNIAKHELADLREEHDILCRRRQQLGTAGGELSGRLVLDTRLCEEKIEVQTRLISRLNAEVSESRYDENS